MLRGKILILNRFQKYDIAPSQQTLLSQWKKNQHRVYLCCDWLTASMCQMCLYFRLRRFLHNITLTTVPQGRYPALIRVWFKNKL